MAADDRYTQREHEQHDNASVAVIQTDMKYMRQDLREIKEQLKESAAIYATKVELLEVKLSLEKSLEAIDKRVTAIYAYGGTILGIVTLALIGAVFKLILKV